MTDMDVAAGMAFLSSLPTGATLSQSFEQSAALNAANGFGADNFAPQPGADFSAQGIKERMQAGWDKAIGKVNSTSK